jgi:hypothetical protein
MSPSTQFDETFRIDPCTRYSLHNRTPRRLVISHPEYGELSLPPLAQRVILGARLAPFSDLLRGPRQRHQVRLREYAEPDTAVAPTLWVWGVLLVLLVVVVGDLVTVGSLWRPEMAAAVVVTVVVVAFVLVRAAQHERKRRAAEQVADNEDGDIEYGVGGAFYDGNETAQRTKHIFLLLLVIVIGAVLPAIAIFVATDMKTFVHLEDGLRVDPGMESRMVSRVVQVVYTGVLALFPALMYFQFDRQRIGTIRGTWVRAIFRMDPRMETLADIDARYGDQLSEASSYTSDSARFLGGKHSPIVVATILMSLGWTLLVIQTDSFDFAAVNQVATASDTASEAADRARAAEGDGGDVGARAAAAEAAADDAQRASNEAASVVAESTGEAVPSTTATTEGAPSGSEGAIAEDVAAAEAAAQQAQDAQAVVDRPLFQLLVPTPSAAATAFLGAYFFAMYLVLRGYFRGDLRPKAYNQITTRFVTVVVLAYLLTVLYTDFGDRNRLLWAVAFLAGVVPSTVLQRMGVLLTDMFHVRTPMPARAPADTSPGPPDGPSDPSGPSTDDGTSRTARVTGWLSRSFAAAFATPRSLTQIDGVDIYESARLESEGIADVTSLARSDLVTTMVSTRLPVERLVDWADQAELIVVVNDGAGDEVDPRIVRLRQLGVRTATDLVRVARARADDGADPGRLRTTVAGLLADGTGACPTAPEQDALLLSLAHQIEREPTMRSIRWWRESELARQRSVPTIHVPERHDDQQFTTAAH